MNRYPALVFFFVFFIALIGGASAYAQSSHDIQGYTPPPMFGPDISQDLVDEDNASSAPSSVPQADDVVTYPVQSVTRSNSVNPAGAPNETPVSPDVPAALNPSLSATAPAQTNSAPATAKPAPAPEPAKKPKIIRKVPPVPPQRPAVLQASQDYLNKQKAEQEEAAAKKIEEEAAAKQALDNELAKKKAAAEAQARAEMEAAKQAEEAKKAIEAAKTAPVQTEETPVAVPEVATPPSVAKSDVPPPMPGNAAPNLPIAPPKPVNQTLLGQQLANPTVQQILDNLEGGKPVPKTALPAGPSDPDERTVMIRSSMDTGPSIRIHAKRPPKKRETANSFFLLFEPNVTDLTDLGESNLEKKILPILNAHPEMTLQVRGYAKSKSGDDNEAQRVSLERADAIRKFFMEKNIGPERIQIHALGSQGPEGGQDRVDIMLVREVGASAVKPQAPTVQAPPEAMGPAVNKPVP